jgi:hypothetical protein
MLTGISFVKMAPVAATLCNLRIQRRPDQDVAHLSFHGNDCESLSIVLTDVVTQFRVRMPIARTFVQTTINASLEVPIQVQKNNKGADLP